MYACGCSFRGTEKCQSQHRNVRLWLQLLRGSVFWLSAALNFKQETALREENMALVITEQVAKWQRRIS
jgi:hypothetical protein